MAFIKGYNFSTEVSAQQAQQFINKYYGIPKSPDDTTQNWTSYQCAELNKPKFWYIVYDDSLLPVLGEPIEFEVATPKPSIP
jgi:hypothetical protein